MASHRRSENRPPIEQDPSTPIQEDDKDILEEVGAERDEDGGYHVSEDKIRELGAVDTESVRINRRNADLVNKKKANVKNVSINTGDVLESYDLLLASWPANSIDIHVKRLTGTPAQDVLTSRPKNGTELLAVLKAFHGQHEEAQYDVRFKDIGTHQFRGNGRITIRDGRLPQQGYPPPGYPPPGYSPPPVPQAAPPSNGHAPAPQQSPFALLQEALDTVQRLQGMQQPQTTPQPPPTVVVPGTANPFSLLQEALDTVQRLQGMHPAQPAAPIPASQQPQLNEALQLVEALQRVARGAQPTTNGAPQQPAQTQPPNPMTFGQNAPPPPPPGMMWTWIHGFGFALAPDNTAQPSPMFRGQRPAYYPNQGQGDPNGNGRPPYTPQPQRQQSPADQFRDALGVLRQARSAFDEMDSLFPGRHDGNERFHEPQENDEHSPVRVDEVGRIKIVRDNDEQGSMRVWESILGNLPDAVKWTADTVEKINKERERRAQPQQLPEGYVEVGPGFRPPPGYKAVIVEDVPQQQQQQQQEEHLPPPPSQVPPPIESPPSPAGWTIPEES